MKTDTQTGWIANVLMSVVGSLLGSWVAGLLGVAPTGGILRSLLALADAVRLLFVLRKLGVFRTA